MILADKIINERKRLCLSQEELAEKLGVSRQAVSKWESAQSVPDLQRILQLAELFNVSTDYLLKDSQSADDHSFTESTETADNLYTVSIEEANEFMSIRSINSKRVSLAVALCIVSPALLIILKGLSESVKSNISEALAYGAGLAFLFLAVAAAVYIFIISGKLGEDFEWLEQERFETAYGVSGLVNEKKKSYQNTHTQGLAGGIVLCVIAALPLIIAGAMGAAEYICIILTAVLLILVAVGVYLIIRVSMVNDSYKILLQEGDYRNSIKLDKEGNEKLRMISGIYWCLMTAIYLGWSFWTMNWENTWIVWPVAGVLFAVVAGISKLFLKKKQA